uniref:cingulin-like n=1 Tax=Myxine glutinosa TaxID=7769 RepID=UPI00358E50A7
MLNQWHTTPVPVPLHWRDVVKAGIDHDVQLGVLEPVPIGEPITWCHRMVVCAKKNGQPRRTVDFQALNAHATLETHHTPSPFYQARSVPNGKKKTVFDAWNGYHSVPICKEDRHLTTFITPWGRYRYKTAPQGFFQAVQWLDTCGQNGITLNPDKFVFGKDIVEFAGFEITPNSVRPCRKYLRAILDFPTPKDITDDGKSRSLAADSPTLLNHVMHQLRRSTPEDQGVANGGGVAEVIAAAEHPVDVDKRLQPQDNRPMVYEEILMKGTEAKKSLKRTFLSAEIEDKGSKVILVQANSISDYPDDSRQDGQGGDETVVTTKDDGLTRPIIGNSGGTDVSLVMQQEDCSVDDTEGVPAPDTQQRSFNVDVVRELDEEAQSLVSVNDHQEVTNGTLEENINRAGKDTTGDRLLWTKKAILTELVRQRAMGTLSISNETLQELTTGLPRLEENQQRTLNISVSAAELETAMRSLKDGPSSVAAVQRCLKDYSAASSTEPSTLPQGIIDLRQSTEIVQADGRTDQKNSLCIVTPERDFYVRGESKEDIAGSHVTPDEHSAGPITADRPKLVQGGETRRISAQDAKENLSSLQETETFSHDAPQGRNDQTAKNVLSGQDVTTSRSSGRPTETAGRSGLNNNCRHDLDDPRTPSECHLLTMMHASRQHRNRQSSEGRTGGSADEASRSPRPLGRRRRVKSLDRRTSEALMMPDELNFKKGWLLNLDNNGQWKKYWFVLARHGLRFYRDSVAEETAIHEGEVDLGGLIATRSVEGAQRNYTFQVQTHSGSFTFAAVTIGIRQSWLEALDKAICSAASPVDLTRLPGDNIGADARPIVASNEGPSPMGSRRGRARQRRREGRNRTFDSAELSRSQGPVSAPQNTQQNLGEIPAAGELPLIAAHALPLEEIEKRWGEVERIQPRDTMQGATKAPHAPTAGMLEMLEEEIEGLKLQLHQAELELDSRQKKVASLSSSSSSNEHKKGDKKIDLQRVKNELHLEIQVQRRQIEQGFLVTRALRRGYGAACEVAHRQERVLADLEDQLRLAQTLQSEAEQGRAAAETALSAMQAWARDAEEELKHYRENGEVKAFKEKSAMDPREENVETVTDELSHCFSFQEEQEGKEHRTDKKVEKMALDGSTFASRQQPTLPDEEEQAMGRVEQVTVGGMGSGFSKLLNDLDILLHKIQDEEQKTRVEGIQQHSIISGTLTMQARERSPSETAEHEDDEEETDSQSNKTNQQDLESTLQQYSGLIGHLAKRMKGPSKHLSDKKKAEIKNCSVGSDLKETEDVKFLEGASGAKNMVLQEDDNLGSTGSPLSDKPRIEENSTLKHGGHAELQEMQEIFIQIKEDFEELRKRFMKTTTKSTDLGSKYRTLQNNYQMLVEECQHEASEVTEQLTLTGLSLVGQDISSGAQNVRLFSGGNTGCPSFSELLENLTGFVMKLKKLKSSFHNQETPRTLPSSAGQWHSAEGYLNVMNESESSISQPERHSSGDIVDQTSCDESRELLSTFDDIESKLMILEGRLSDTSKLLTTSCFHCPHLELQYQNDVPAYSVGLPSSPSPLSSTSTPTSSQSSSVSTVSLKELPQKQTFIGMLEAKLATLSEEEQVNVLLEKLAVESALLSHATGQQPDVQAGVDYHRKQVDLLLSAWLPHGAWNSYNNDSSILNKCPRGEMSDLHPDEINEDSVKKPLEVQLLNTVVISGILALILKNMQTSSRQRIIELEQELSRTFHCEQEQERLLLNIREASSLHEVREQLKTLGSISLDWKNKEDIERLQKEITNQWKHDSSVVEDYQRLRRCLKELQTVIGRDQQEPDDAFSSDIASSSNNTAEAGHAGDTRIEMLQKELEQAGQRLYQRIQESEKVMEQLTSALDVVIAGHAKCLEDTEAVRREAEGRLQVVQNNFSHDKEHLTDTHKEEVNRLPFQLPQDGEPLQASRQLRERCALELGDTNVQQTNYAALCKRNSQLEKRVETLCSELDRRPPCEYVMSLRSKHHKELNSLKATCERGLVAMDEAHVRLVKELQRGHRRELTRMQHQQERLLAEETAATVAENLWAELTHQIDNLDQQPTSMPEFQQTIVIAWQAIPVQTLANLVNTMPQRGTQLLGLRKGVLALVTRDRYVVLHLSVVIYLPDQFGVRLVKRLYKKEVFLDSAAIANLKLERLFLESPVKNDCHTNLRRRNIQVTVYKVE